ncbi:MAG: hypothetical protein ACLFSB_16710 [Chitinispirillaceae bacterium]
MEEWLLKLRREVQLQASTLDTPKVLTWKYFHVPGWWIAKKGIPYHHGVVDVRNVRWIQILTPEIVSYGKGRIEFRKLELRGKWISRGRSHNPSGHA